MTHNDFIAMTKTTVSKGQLQRVSDHEIKVCPICHAVAVPRIDFTNLTEFELNGDILYGEAIIVVNDTVKDTRMKSISVYYRKGSVFIVPQLGITDVGPVFTAELDEGDVATGLRNAIAVNPAEQALPATGADYRSPVLAAMNV